MYKVVGKQRGFQNMAKFIINHMDTDTAGHHQCQYRKIYSWSEHSEALEPMLTGETTRVSSPWVSIHSYFS